MSNISRKVRNDTYRSNLNQLEETLYGMDEPIWPFISVNGKYSEDKCRGFIEDVLGYLKDDAFLFDFLYLMVRMITTEYSSYYVLEEGRAYTDAYGTICPAGKKEENSFRTLLECLRTTRAEKTAVEIYMAVCGEPDKDVAQFAKKFKEYDFSEEAEIEADEYFDAWMEEYPDEIEKELSEMPDDAVPEMRTDPEERRSEERTAYQQYLKQQKDLAASFPGKRPFCRSMETYAKHVMKYNDHHFYYTRADEYALLFNRLKNYMLQREGTVFDQRETMVDVNAELIRAELIASGKAGK